MKTSWKTKIVVKKDYISIIKNDNGAIKYQDIKFDKIRFTHSLQKITEEHLKDCIDRRGQWYEDKLMKLIDCLESNLDIDQIKDRIEYVLKVTGIIPKE